MSTVLTRPRRFNSVDEWLAWLETLHPKKIDFSLGRMRQVVAALALDPPNYRVITVGGTNGKGSCVALLENIYLSAGYSVGAFTSPHLWRFNERIRLDGRDVGDETLMNLFELMDIGRGDITLSYFESSAVAAMLHFQRLAVDVGILEVGMGGRLDAVNALDADAALIVSIDMDHMDWLGPDRETIAIEKAGIARPNRPVIVADADPPASLFAVLEASNAVVRLIGRDFRVEVEAEGIRYSEPDDSAGQNSRLLPQPAFGGEFQVTNVAACVAVVDSLADELPVSDEAIFRGIGNAKVEGRIDIREIDGAEWIFDVAHNPAAATLFSAAVATRPIGETVAVFGAMRDKNMAAVLAPFVADIDQWFVAGVESERSASGDEVRDELVKLGARGISVYADVAAATLAARAAQSERVLVFGSFYTVGPAMEAVGLYCPPHSAG